MNRRGVQSPESELTGALRAFDNAIQKVLEAVPGLDDSARDRLAIALSDNPALCTHLGKAAQRYVLAREEAQQ